MFSKYGKINIWLILLFVMHLSTIPAQSIIDIYKNFGE